MYRNRSRQEIIDMLISYITDEDNDPKEVLENMLLNGFKGFSNMTDEEILKGEDFEALKELIDEEIDDLEQM